MDPVLEVPAGDLSGGFYDGADGGASAADTPDAWAAGEGRCVVGVLHDVNLALDLADLFLLMEEGRARYFGPAAEFDPATLNRVYQMDVGGYMRRSLQRWEELE